MRESFLFNSSRLTIRIFFYLSNLVCLASQLWTSFTLLTGCTWLYTAYKRELNELVIALKIVHLHQIEKKVINFPPTNNSLCPNFSFSKKTFLITAVLLLILLRKKREIFFLSSNIENCSSNICCPCLKSWKLRNCFFRCIPFFILYSFLYYLFFPLFFILFLILPFILFLFFPLFFFLFFPLFFSLFLIKKLFFKYLSSQKLKIYFHSKSKNIKHQIVMKNTRQ